MDKRVRTEISRQNENEEKRNARLLDKRIRTEISRQNENEDQREIRLVEQRKRTLKHRSNSKQRKAAHIVYGATSLESAESVIEQDLEGNETMDANILSQQSILQQNQLMGRNQYVWPTAIPKKLKEKCLEEFSNHMSMSFLRQSICIICNSRVHFSTMKEYPLEEIPNLKRLSCHTDVLNVISKTQQQLAHGIDMSLSLKISFSYFFQR